MKKSDIEPAARELEALLDKERSGLGWYGRNPVWARDIRALDKALDILRVWRALAPRGDLSDARRG
jgi:hypothetical protein